MPNDERSFEAAPFRTERGHVRLPLPFDPREEWGVGARAKVAGSVAGTRYEGTLGIRDGVAFLVLNAGFRDRAGISVGEPVEVELAPLGD